MFNWLHKDCQQREQDLKEALQAHDELLQALEKERDDLYSTSVNLTEQCRDLAKVAKEYDEAPLVQEVSALKKMLASTTQELQAQREQISVLKQENVDLKKSLALAEKAAQSLNTYIRSSSSMDYTELQRRLKTFLESLS